MKPLITVFTPTFNRKHTLLRTYQSLLAQSSKNFEWLIIDDGSTDGTEELVQSWIVKKEIAIKYIYKDNGGMHTAHNTAYRIIDTELNVCVDSDDMLASRAIAIIETVWEKIKNCNFAGIIGLDADFDNHILGSKFPKSGTPISLSEYYRSGGSGDKKLVYRTEIISKYPEYPEYAGEKLVPLSFKYGMIDRDYKLYAINEILCNVEYQQDGSTANIRKQYKMSPRGFNDYRIENMKHPTSVKELIKNTLHYISGCIYLGDKNIIRKSPRKALTIILFPIGVAFHYYLEKNK